MSVSALMVDNHGVLAQQELDHIQVFTIGAGTVTPIDTEITSKLQTAQISMKNAIHPTCEKQSH